MRPIVLGILLFVQAGTPLTPRWPSGDEADILEAVLRYRFLDNQSGIVLREGRFVRRATNEPVDLAVCVELKRTTAGPPEAADLKFLSRWAAVPAIAKGSHCKGDLSGDYELETRAPAIIFVVGPVILSAPGVASAGGGYHRSGLNAAWCNHEVRLTLGVWTASETGICTVS